MELKEMSVPALIEQARARGINPRGMTRDEIIEAIESVSAGQILQTADDIPKSARYEGLELRVQTLEKFMDDVRMEVGLIPKVDAATKALSALSWKDLVILARSNGIKTYGKKRPEIEALLKEKDNG